MNKKKQKIFKLKTETIFSFCLNPFYIAILYFGLIPIYAYLYNEYLPYEFYHSTFQFEHANLNESNKLEEELYQTILENYKSSNGFIKNNYFSLDEKKPFDLENIEYSEKGVEFSLKFQLFYSKSGNFTDKNNDYTLHGDNLGGEIMQSINIVITNEELRRVLLKQPININEMYFVPVREALLQPQSKQNSLKKMSLKEEQPEWEPINIKVYSKEDLNKEFLSNLFFPRFGLDFIYIDKNLIRRIYGHIYGVKGYSSSLVPANYSRMFYLSAITITTTGFGDIVPLTDSARYLISSEAIIGVFLIGLFFFQLANSKKNK